MFSKSPLFKEEIFSLSLFFKGEEMFSKSPLSKGGFRGDKNLDEPQIITVTQLNFAGVESLLKCLFSEVRVVPTRATNRRVCRSKDWRILALLPSFHRDFLPRGAGRQIDRCTCQKQQKKRHKNDCKRSCILRVEGKNFVLIPSFRAVGRVALTVFRRRPCRFPSFQVLAQVVQINRVWVMVFVQRL